ncbi:hypothetical protein ACSFXN_04075 [Planococcus sp. 1R117A]|uniref:hypothetical protein n=1 Tax=Planococcus sp. 1R117A TaxID=3447020 RepID=UPI003EDBCDC5
MEQQLNNAFAFAQGDGKTYWFLGSLLEMKATSEDTGSAFGMVELTHPPDKDKIMEAAQKYNFEELLE